MYASAVWDKNLKEIIVKVVNTSDKVQATEIQLGTAKKIFTNANMLILRSENLDGVNSLDNPTEISPKELPVKLRGKNASLSLPPYSMTVVRVKAS